LVEAADEAEDGPDVGDGESAPLAFAPMLASGAVQGLFAQLEVRPTAGRGLRIDAPPEAAATLAARLGGLAQLLGRAAGPERSAAPGGP